MTTEPNRRVLFAVELFDPVAGTVVSKGMTVQLSGASGYPIVNASGRFVWLVGHDADTWPKTFTVRADGAPFASEVVQVKAPAQSRPDDRFARITLRPTAAYPFEAGVTAVRGCLREAENDKRPVAGARVLLAWLGHDSKWVPPFPAGGGQEPPPLEVETDARGEFGVFARIGAAADPDVDKKGLLMVRVQVTRPTPTPRTLVTPLDFPFVPDKDAAGRVPEGRLLAPDVQLRWSDLKPPPAP